MAKKQQATIYIIGGGKGGVGKTMCSLALTDYLVNEAKEANIVGVETDDSNPDFFKSIKKLDEVKKEVINLDDEAGWIKFMNMMPEFANNGANVVVNTAARATPHLEKYLNELQNGCNELQIQLHLVWVINRQRDSILLLNNVVKAAPNTKTTVVKNLYFGEAEKFVIFDSSKLKEKTDTIELPDLNDNVSDKIYSDRLVLSDVNEFGFGEKMALQRFRTKCVDSFKVLTTQQVTSTKK